jgi:thiol:disulfide interchange protein
MKNKNRLLAWLALFVVAALALAVVAVPVWLIQPFAPQTERGLAISFALKSWSPILTLIATALSFAIAVWLWINSRSLWTKAVLILPLFLILVSVWFARQNHFEWMFNPLANSAYAKASETDFVNDEDMVLAVEINNEAVAYPVRQMAYHHVVEDTVGGVPIAATY